MSVDAVNSSMAAALNQVYQTAPQTKAATPEETGSGTMNITDVLALSPEGRKALEFPWLFGVKPFKPATLAFMDRYATNELDSFSEKFQALLRDNGIDTSQPITLGLKPGTGRVIVTSDHPDAEKIATLLEEEPKLKNPKLHNIYRGAIKALEIVKHGEEHEKFDEAYAENPQAAAAEYAYLFNGQFNATWSASVKFSGDGYEVAYNRAVGQ